MTLDAAGAAMPRSPSDELQPSPVATGVVDWAKRDPHRVAVVDLDRSISFAELDAVAGSLATRVTELAPTQWLPVIVDRSVDAAMALHGVIRAGRRFVPIESTTPRDRVASFFARLGEPTHAVVSKPEHSALLPSGVHAIEISGPAAEPDSPVPVDGSEAGFVVFTSGSTGRPKAVVRRWSSCGRRPGVNAPSASLTEATPWRVAVLQPFSFSPGLRTIGSIGLGQSVRIANPANMSIDAMLDWLNEQSVDEINLSATLAATILRGSGGQRRLPTLTQLRLGSEASSWELVAPLRELIAPDASIVTGYGASECGRLFNHVVGPDHPIGQGRIPMGQPNEAWRARLVPVDGDESVTQLVVGDPDALCYLDDPELTARRFSTDENGVLWWTSGDVVVVDVDGIYHHRGRIDDMVKINGMLVEPREPEEALRAIPGIGNAAVLAHNTPSGKTRLIAHLRVDDPDLTPEAVHAQLESHLPKHLLPAMMVRHDELPHNERNKLDRAALQRSGLTRWRSLPPRVHTSELELWLTAQLADLLDLGDVGPEDDMWRLGLDSLGAVELCAIIANAGLGELDPTALLTVRSAAALTERLRDKHPNNRSLAVVLNPAGINPPVFAVPGRGGTALTFRSLAQSLGVEQPLVALEPRGMHQAGRPDRTIAGLARRARPEIERRMTRGVPCVLLGYSAGATVAYELAQQLHADGQAVHLVLLDAAPGPRNAPADGPAKGAPGGPRSASPTLIEKLRARPPRELVADVPRLTAKYGRKYLMRARLWFPSPGITRSHLTQQYYSEIGSILSRATKRYEVAPAAFPVTLVLSEFGDPVLRSASIIERVAVVQVPGNHYTMLQQPNVSAVADVVASLNGVA